MFNDSVILISTAAFLAFFHTITGPDHYVPFIAIAQSRKWNKSKTALITLLCGLGHVLSSIIIGFVGILLGTALFSVETIESYRGEIAGWFLIAFGFAYSLWGIWKLYSKKPHRHIHRHSDGRYHKHEHTHEDEHVHVLSNKEKNITPWILFVIFVFGPCEPLIPIVMYPAAAYNYSLVLTVSIVFAIITISTMLLMTFLGLYGLSILPVNKLEKYMHLIAGLTVLLCGISVKFLGL